VFGSLIALQKEAIMATLRRETPSGRTSESLQCNIVGTLDSG